MRGDQIPVLPHYVELHHVNLENALPNSSDFLDSVNGDIAAVLQVPRVASGQEKGSTFAATFNANMWAVQAISRMHRICHDSCSKLFSLHLNLLNIPHTMQDLPQIEFDTMDTETPLNTMQRVTMGYTNGLITLNQSLEMLNLPLIGAEGEKRLDMNSPSEVGEVPRENTQPGATDIVDAE